MKSAFPKTIRQMERGVGTRQRVADADIFRLVASASSSTGTVRASRGGRGDRFDEGRRGQQRAVGRVEDGGQRTGAAAALCAVRYHEHTIIRCFKENWSRSNTRFWWNAVRVRGRCQFEADRQYCRATNIVANSRYIGYIVLPKLHVSAARETTCGDSFRIRPRQQAAPCLNSNYERSPKIG